MIEPQTLLEVHDLKKHFPIYKGLFHRQVGTVRAVDGVSFTLKRGETLALVGESGCGKTTLGRTIVRAYRPTSGKLIYHDDIDLTTNIAKLMVHVRTAKAKVSDRDAIDLANLNRRDLQPYRSGIQMIFQDPFSSLNPRMTLLEIVGEPLLIHGMRDREQRVERVAELLTVVGLRREYMQRFPHAFSGGQRQRIGIARALALNPSLIVADEAVSALDVSVQAQILNLMLDLQEKLGLAYLFVAHDLSVVKQISDRVAVMYVGRIVELAPTTTLYDRPFHPYTEALLAAVPKPDPRLRGKRMLLAGEVADPANPPPGCAFHRRCPYVIDRCKVERPELRPVGSGSLVACHRADELTLKGVSEAL